MRDLTIKAQQVVSLAKPVPSTISSTFNSYISEVLKKFQVDAKLQTAFTTRATSHILYHNMEYFLKQVQTVPMELAVQINGLKFLFNTLVKSLTGLTTVEEIHSELNQMVENLEITVHDKIPFNIGTFAKISDDI